MSSSADLLARILEFERRFLCAQATEVIDLPWGFAVLQHEFPKSYSHNRLVVTRGGMTAAPLVDAADDVLGGAGLAHRLVAVQPGVADLPDLVPAFAAAGYEHQPLVTMVHSGAPPRAPAHPVAAVDFATLRPELIRDWQGQLPDADEDTLAQLADRVQLAARGARLTLLAVLDESGEAAAHGELYLDGRLAQLESLVTRPRCRGRGYGAAIVAEALRRSAVAGCDLAFLVAERDDWPRRWYGRFGYTDLAQSHVFQRHP